MLDKTRKYFYLWMFPLFWIINQWALTYDYNLHNTNFITAIICLFIYNPLHISADSQKKYFITLSAIALLSLFIPLQYNGPYLFIFALLVTYYLSDNQRIKYSDKLIIMASVYFHLTFITQTPLSAVQHDAASCYNYIDYILENDFMFWHENPLLTRPSYSSFHPILHFFIAALSVRAGTLLHFSRAVTDEALQIIFLFYILWYNILCAKILKMFNLQHIIYITLLAFICFFPYYTPLSGFINNDALLLPLQAGIIYHTLQYAQSGKKKTLFLMWIYTTFASLTKLSFAVMLPFIGIALLYRLIKAKEKNTFYEICIFSFITLLSISIWPLYQEFILNTDYTYTPTYASGISLENYSYIKRLSPLTVFLYEQPFYRSFIINLWETLTKTALFDEQNFHNLPLVINNSMLLLTFCYKLIILIVMIAFIYCCIKKIKNPLFVFTLFMYIGLFSGIIAFALERPYTCNQNFRYIAILPLVQASTLALFIPPESKYIKYFIIFLLWIFCALSSYIWQWISWNI